MDEHQQQLVSYIQNQLQSGASLEAVRAALIQAGWQVDMVDQATQTVSAAANPLPAPIEEAPAVQQSYQPAQSYPNQPVQQTQPFAGQFEAQAQPNDVAAGQPQQTGQPDTNVPQKYRVFRSIFDGLKAMKNNFPAYLSAVVSSLLIAGAAIGALTLVTAMLGMKMMGMMLSSNPMVGLMATLGGVLILFMIFYAVVYAFMMASMSYPLMSGAEHRQDNVLKILLHAIKRTPKIILGNIIVYIVTVGPLIAALSVILGFTFATRPSASASFGLFGLSFIAYLAGLAWIIIALLRYALTPYVIMFEENVSVGAALKRSRHLLSHGGQWFLFKGSLMVLLVVFIIAAVSGQNLRQLQNSDNWGINVLFLILVVLINNSMVMLYRNRNLVRGNQ